MAGYLAWSYGAKTHYQLDCLFKVHFKRAVTVPNENTNADAAPPPVQYFDSFVYWQYFLNYLVPSKFQQAPLLCVRVLNENKGCCIVIY